MDSAIIDNLTPFMIYKGHMDSWNRISPNVEKITEPKLIPPKVSKLTIPPHIHDTLFWCFYIIVEGYHSADYVFQSPFKYEQEFKYKCIAKLKPKVSLLKSMKLNIQSVESDIVMNKFLTVSNLSALAIAQEQSIVIQCDELYYDFNYGTSYSLIQRRGHTFFLHLGDVSESIRDIQQNCYCIDPRKAFKSMSAYTLKDLQMISEKLKLPICNGDKPFKKQILYDEITSKIKKLT